MACDKEADIFNRGPVEAEGIFEDGTLPADFAYSELRRRLIDQRFLFVEQFGLRNYERTPGPHHLRFYLAEVDNPACETTYPGMVGETFSSDGPDISVPRDLCIASEEVLDTIAPYAHQRIDIHSRFGYKGFEDRLVELKTGITVAQYRELIIYEGNRWTPQGRCVNLFWSENRQKLVREMGELTEVVQPAGTTQFLDMRNTPADSPVRRFYAVRRSRGEPVSRLNQPLPPVRVVDAVLQAETTLNQQISEAEFGRRFRKPGESQDGLAYSHYCTGGRLCLHIDIGDGPVEAPVPMPRDQIEWVSRSGDELTAISDIDWYGTVGGHSFWIFKYRGDGTLLASTQVNLPDRRALGHLEKPIISFKETDAAYQIHILEFDSRERGRGPFQLLADIELAVAK